MKSLKDRITYLKAHKLVLQTTRDLIYTEQKMSQLEIFVERQNKKLTGYDSIKKHAGSK